MKCESEFHAWAEMEEDEDDFDDEPDETVEPFGEMPFEQFCSEVEVELSSWDGLVVDSNTCIRKMVEELGELSEALHFADGSTTKVSKFDGEDAGEKVVDEICDLMNVVMRMAFLNGVPVTDLLVMCLEKMREKNTEWKNGQTELF